MYTAANTPVATVNVDQAQQNEEVKSAKLMINIFNKAEDAVASNNLIKKRRFTTETLEFKLENYEQLKKTSDEFAKPFLTEEKPEFIIKAVVPPSDDRKRMVKRLKDESDFVELLSKLTNNTPIMFVVKLVNKKNLLERKHFEKKKLNLTPEQEQALNEKKQIIETLKEEIKMKKDQIKTVKLEMKTIRLSAKQTTDDSTTSVSSEPLATTEQSLPISKLEKLQLKLKKKEEKKAFKLEKKMLKAQHKLEKIAMKKQRKQQEEPASTTQPEAVLLTTTTISEPTAPVSVTEVEPVVTAQVVMVNTTSETASNLITDEKLLFKLQKKEQKLAMKMEKKLEKQMIKAQRKLEKHAQKQERKERKLLEKQQDATTTPSQN